MHLKINQAYCNYTAKLCRSTFFSILLLFCLPSKFLLFAQNDQPSIYISEVYPAPNSTESEWIELYNPTDSAVLLTGWQLFEHVSQTSKLVEFTEVTIPPSGFFVFELSSNKLNNSQEKVTLVQPDGTLHDSFEYSNSESEKSFSRLFQNDQITQNIAVTNPTKGEKNAQVPQPLQTPIASTPSPTPDSTQQNSNNHKNIQIIEVVNCPPSGTAETVTVQNTDTVHSTEISNWRIKDAQNNAVPIPQLELQPQEIYAIQLKQTILNNSGDTVWLLDDENTVISEKSAPTCTPTTQNNNNQSTQNNQKSVSRSSTGSIDNFSDSTANQTTTGSEKKDQFYKLLNLLEFPQLEKYRSDDFPEQHSKLSFLTTKQVSKEGVISAIIGGSLLLLGSFLLKHSK